MPKVKNDAESTTKKRASLIDGRISAKKKNNKGVVKTKGTNKKYPLIPLDGEGRKVKVEEGDPAIYKRSRATQYLELTAASRKLYALAKELGVTYMHLWIKECRKKASPKLMERLSDRIPYDAWFEYL
jgi:hypothetical protein